MRYLKSQKPINNGALLNLTMYKVEYKIEDEKPVIYVFSRDKDKQKRVERVTSFEPYFYILSDDTEKARKIKGIRRIEEEKKKGLNGENVVKVFCKTPSEVKDLRNKFKKTFEADILFTNRYMIDAYKTIDKTELRVCFLDIETNTDEIFPNLKEAEHEITAIACYDSFDKQCHVFTWRKDFEQEIEKKTYTFQISNAKRTVRTIIHKFGKEKEMLLKLISYIKEKDPDIISGWNVENFDMQYLLKRMEKIKVDPSQLSNLEDTKIRKGMMGTEVSVKGRVVFDLLTGYRKLLAGQMEFYTLDFVSEKELGAKKVAMEKTWGKMWKQDFDKFIEYNVKDAYLVYEIDRKRRVIDYFDEVRRMAHCDLKDVFLSMKTSDSFILSYCKDKYALPTKKSVEKRKRLKGAIVLDPVRGLHDNVAVVDLKSLYPNIIISCNISPETLLKKKEKDCVTIGNTYFSKKRIGIFPEILEWIFNKRLEMQKERDKHEKGSEEYEVLEAKQYAIKIVMNSFYGVSANPHFRLYKQGVGDAITRVGRETVLWSKKTAEKNGYGVLYGDTDSIFLKTGKENEEDAIKDGKQAEEALNKSYQELLAMYNAPKQKLKVEFEKMYKKLLLFPETKKRYAGLITWYKGKHIKPEISVTGLESIRSDSSKLAKKAQKQVLKMVFEEKNRQEIEEYLKDVRNRIIQGEINYEEIGISSPLKKPIRAYKVDRPSVRAAKYSNKNFGMSLDVGSRFYIIYVKYIPDHPKTDVVAFRYDSEIPRGTEIDVKKHVEEVTGGKIERIFNAIGWRVEGEQKNLSKWF